MALDARHRPVLGVLTEVDIEATLKEKLVDIEPQIILGPGGVRAALRGVYPHGIGLRQAARRAASGRARTRPRGSAAGATRGPASPWTVELLARTVGLSRAAFARRLTAAVAEPPLTCLTGWRIALAKEALHRDGSTLGSVAREVGYANERRRAG